MVDKMLGIYIHVPFCASKCSYCDFYSLTGQSDRVMDRYLEALKKHIRESASRMDSYYIDTVYFGGGTPSYFGAKRIAKLLGEVRDHNG